LGGKFDKKEKYIEPTILLNPGKNSSIMNEEIFGPILPIMKFDNIQEVEDHINSNHKPLALYYFGKGNSDRI
jgi:aldehyde dehydrogenase (NAD+)